MSDEKGGKTDPLTSATRATKRNLLATSVVAITFKAFDISTGTIPIVGLVIPNERGVFQFLLAMLLVYFLLTFALYYYIDIRNFPRLKHQDATVAWRQAKWQGYLNRQEHELVAAFGGVSSSDLQVSNQSIMSTTQEWSRGLPSVWEFCARMNRLPLAARKHANFMHHGEGQFRLYMFSEQREPLVDVAADAVDQAWKPILKAAPWKYARFKMSLRPRLWTVSSLYIIRNYGVDGLLPALIAIVAILTLYNLIDLHFLTSFGPSA